MRTVSFSSTPVRRLLNNDFVCALINTEGDPSAGSSCAHAPTDNPGPCSRGIGHQNVQCLFLTAKGEILHAASGFITPDDLRQELEFALTTWKALKKSPLKARQLVVDVHAKRLKTLGYDGTDIQGPRATMMQDMMHGRGVDSIFELKTRRTVLNDHKFSMQYPLLPMSLFVRQPQLLVGNERTSFSSTSNGMPSGGKIGR